ncbi:dCMP deaminase [Nematocida sp. AWRm77]|nr:dCMP deaminase [Nematocida sp. AWRm77]
MLFCIISILPLACKNMLEGLAKHGVVPTHTQDGFKTELAANTFWMENKATILHAPSEWKKICRKPGTLLVYVHPKNTNPGIEALRAEEYARHSLQMMDIRNGLFLNASNYLEVLEEDELSLQKILSHNPRPSWEEYFMSIAETVSLRSNCMKRKVGAVIVKNNRIVATGYNGTATGSLNCNQGGCQRCNDNVKQGSHLSDCFCVHAEESAFLDAGSNRCAGADLYTTVFPCIQCSRKIIQMNISKVYYMYEYVDNNNIREYFSKHNVGMEKLKEQR